MMIRGETVTLYSKTQTGTDPLGKPVYEEKPDIQVENVLIAPGASSDILDSTDLEGKHIEYTLSIPKGDTNTWESRKVVLRGEVYRTVGKPYYYTEENVPLAWNGRIMVERDE